MPETYRAVNFTNSWYESGESEVGSHCCDGHHDTLGEAIVCFENQGEHAFGSGLHGGGHEFRAYDDDNRYRSIEQESEEYQDGVDEAVRIREQ